MDGALSSAAQSLVSGRPLEVLGKLLAAEEQEQRYVKGYAQPSAYNVSAAECRAGGQGVPPGARPRLVERTTVSELVGQEGRLHSMYLGGAYG